MRVTPYIRAALLLVTFLQWTHLIPCLTVEVGTETIQVDANAAEEPERTRLYNKMTETYAGFNEYQRKTARVIPVIVLTPVKKHRPDVNVWAVNTKPVLQAKSP